MQYALRSPNIAPAVPKPAPLARRGPRPGTYGIWWSSSSIWEEFSSSTEQKLNPGPLPPRERSLRRQRSSINVLKHAPKKTVLKREETLRRFTGPGCMPGGLRPVLTLGPEAFNDPSTSTSTAEPAEQSTPLKPIETVLSESAFSSPPGSFKPKRQPTVIIEKDQPEVISSMDVDDDDVFQRQMRSLKGLTDFREGVEDERDRIDRAEKEEIGAKIAEKQRVRKAKAEKKAKERAEEAARRRARREAKARAEKEARRKAKREAKEQAEREAREAAERERQLEEERLRREAEARAAQEKADRERAEQEAKDKAEREAAEQRAREEQERAAEEASSETQNPLQNRFWVYDGKWALLSAGFTERKLFFPELPWPTLQDISDPADISDSVLAAFLFHKDRPEAQGKSRRQVLKAEVIRWHPDRFDTKVLAIMEDCDKEKTAETAGKVARIMTEMLNRY